MKQLRAYLIRSSFCVVMLLPFFLLAGDQWLHNAALSLAIAAGVFLLSMPLGLLRGRWCVLATGLCMASIIGGLGFLPIAPLSEVALVFRLVYGVIPAVTLAIAVRELSAGMFAGPRGAVVGFVLYGVLSIVLRFMPGSEGLNGLTYGCVVLFLALTVLALNRESLALGVNARKETRPPARLRGRNRLMVAVFAAVVAFVSYFDQIQKGVQTLWEAMLLKLWEFIVWISTMLFPGTQGGQQGTATEKSTFIEQTAEAPNPFWAVMEKVAYVVAFLILLVVLYFAGRKLVQLARLLYQRLKEYFQRFTAAMGEAYVDERESLFDWDEYKGELKRKVQTGIRRLTEREKRWEQMNPRERVRSVVRTLYRRAGDSIGGLSALTVREAAPRLPLGETNREQFVELYERARYSDEEIQSAEAEEIRHAGRR